MKLLLILLFSVVGIYSSIRSYQNSKKNNFYGNTSFLNLFGIYVWGDGLIIGPFWLLSAGIFTVIDEMWIIRYIVLFYAVRSLVEIIYWINHQVAQRDYNPPLFNKISWLKPNESAILYQLLHTLVVVVLTFYFIYSLV